MQRIRLLLVDDSEVFACSARDFLADNADFEVSGVVNSVSEMLTLLGTIRVDLVIMDINMPLQNGLEGARLLKASPAPPNVVLISLADSTAIVTAALAAGADGFVAKSALGTELPPLIPRLCALRSA